MIISQGMYIYGYKSNPLECLIFDFCFKKAGAITLFAHFILIHREHVGINFKIYQNANR